MITFPTSRDGLILGELTAEEIEQALEKGSLRQNDYVWSHQTERWIPVYEAFEITEQLIQIIERNSRPLLEAGLAQLPELPPSNANHSLNPSSIGLGNRNASSQPMAKTMMVDLPEETIYHGNPNAVPQALAKTMMVSLPEAEPAPAAFSPVAKTMMIELPESEFNTAAKPMSKTAVVELPIIESLGGQTTGQLSQAITKEMAKTMLVDIPEEKPQQAIADAKAAITNAESNPGRYKPQGGHTTSLIPKPKTRPIAVSVLTNTGPLKPVAPITGPNELKRAQPYGSVPKPISSRTPVAHHVEETSTRFAGGWIIAGVLSVAAVMGLLSWLSSLLHVPETAEMKDNDINSITPAIVNCKRLMTALHAYAAAHSGLLPLKLSDLEGQNDLPTMAEINFLPRGARGKGGLDYPGSGVRMDAPPNTVILKSRWQTVGKRSVVGRLDGTIDILKQE